MNKVQTRGEAIKMVMSVLANGRRPDRYLRQDDAGEYFTTPDYEFLTSEGREIPACVKIPVSYEGTEEDDMDWADTLIRELDVLIAAE